MKIEGHKPDGRRIMATHGGLVVETHEAMQRRLSVDRLASRIDRAGMIETGGLAFTTDDAGYASILKAFSPQERATLVAALRNSKSQE